MRGQAKAALLDKFEPFALQAGFTGDAQVRVLVFRRFTGGGTFHRGLGQPQEKVANRMAVNGQVIEMVRTAEEAVVAGGLAYIPCARGARESRAFWVKEAAL